MAELNSRRTQRNKTFDNGDGTYTEVAALTDLHYESEVDSGVFDAEVDFTPVRVDTAQFDGWRVTQGGWHYALGKDLASHGDQDGWVGFGGRQGAHWLKFRLLRVGYLHWPTRGWEDLGGVPNYDRANLSRETHSRELYLGVHLNLASVAKWGDIWTTPGGGLMDVCWRPSGRSLKEDISINQTAREWIAANSPPSTPITETWFGFIFQLDWSDVPKVLKNGILQDKDSDWSAGGPVELRDAADRLLAFLPVGHVHVGMGKLSSLPLQKRFWRDGNGNHYLLIGARVDLINGLPVGDLVFDPTVNPPVGASADDAITWPPNNFSNSGDHIYIGNDGNWNHGGMRFTLNVPASATISAATVTFTASADRATDTVRTKIHYEDTNDPGDFSTDTYAIFEARTRSAASIDWDFTTDWTTDTTYNTDDISTIIQALVNEAYWASGEHCVIFVEDDSSDSTAYRQAYTWDNSSADAAVLNVTYTTGGIVILRRRREGY